MSREGRCEEVVVAARESQDRLVALARRVQAARHQPVAETLQTALAESDLVLQLADHAEDFNCAEAEAEMKIIRIKDENDWLREELEDTEKRLEDVLSKIAQLEVEKEQNIFMEEVGYILQRCSK